MGRWTRRRLRHALQPLHRRPPAVRAAVVDHPEHPPGRGVRLGGHDLLHQPAEGLDAGRRLAAAEQPGLVHLPGRQIRQRSAPLVSCSTRTTRATLAAGGVAAAAGLDGGLLVGADDVLVFAERLASEHPLVEVEDDSGLGSQVGGNGESSRSGAATA